MTPHSLWTIILKIFGIYMLIQVIGLIPQFFSILASFTFDNNAFGSDKAVLIFQVAYFLFSLGIQLLIFNILVFKTDWLIDRLHLLKGFADENFELNIHRSTIWQVVIIFFGLYLLMEGIPVLLGDLFKYYQNAEIHQRLNRYPSTGSIIIEFVRVLFGIFMTTSSRLIVNFIERKRRGKPEANTDGEI